MIRIIDETPDPSAVKRTLCLNCGVRLEYTKSDTRTETHTDYAGGSDTYRMIDCPKCNKPINLGFC